MEVRVDDRKVDTVPVRTTIVTQARVWTLAASLERGHVISEADITETRVVSSKADGLVPAVESIIGLEVNRSLAAGQPLKRHYLVAPVCAQRGDRVEVHASRGGLQVSLRATALATGRKGERILCQNERSKRRFLVRLTGTRRAELDF